MVQQVSWCCTTHDFGGNLKEGGLTSEMERSGMEGKKKKREKRNMIMFVFVFFLFLFVLERKYRGKICCW